MIVFRCISYLQDIFSRCVRWCVVSAQGQGLLCEVPRSTKDDNVKYIGYCSYHYKKMVCVTFYFSALTSFGLVFI